MDDEAAAGALQWTRIERATVDMIAGMRADFASQVAASREVLADAARRRAPRGAASFAHVLARLQAGTPAPSDGADGAPLEPVAHAQALVRAARDVGDGVSASIRSMADLR